jgi:molecular chaperone DnaJ
MSTASRDYYEILGVPRDADDAAIKRAFRKLARELHPDVNPGDPTAEARFKEVAEAYEVLGDTESRSVYDRYGHDGLRSQGRRPGDFSGFGSFQDIFDAFFGGDIFGGGRRGPRRQAGDDHLARVDLSFVDSARDSTHVIAVDLVAACETCEGTGAAVGSELVTCSTCDGRGQVQQVMQSALGQFVRATVCPECRGAGQYPETPCADCRGLGRRMTHQDISVTVPAGIDDGQRVRLPGRGHAGDPGAPSGDLYVEVHVVPDERFERDGLDIVTQVNIPVADAMTGCRVSVPTVDGDVDIELPAGTQPFHEHVLRGKGFPAIQRRGRGDQRVYVVVDVPAVTSTEGRELLGTLADHAQAGGSSDGFFRRLTNRRR